MAISAATINAMEAAGMSAEQILAVVKKEAEERAARSRESNRLRQAAFQARKKAAQSNADNADNATNAVSDVIPVIPPEPRARVVNTTLPSEEISNIPPLPPKARNRGHRLPEGWQPDVELISFSRSLGFSTDQELRARAEFADYWRGVPGSRGCKLDWPATYRNRLRELAAKMKLKPVANVLPFTAGSDPPRPTYTAEEKRRIAEDFDRRYRAGEFG